MVSITDLGEPVEREPREDDVREELDGGEERIDNLHRSQSRTTIS